MAEKPTGQETSGNQGLVLALLAMLAGATLHSLAAYYWFPKVGLEQDIFSSLGQFIKEIGPTLAGSAFVGWRASRGDIGKPDLASGVMMTLGALIGDSSQGFPEIEMTVRYGFPVLGMLPGVVDSIRNARLH